MLTYNFHPEVRGDLDEIWQFIAADNPDDALPAALRLDARLCKLIP